MVVTIRPQYMKKEIVDCVSLTFMLGVHTSESNIRNLYDTYMSEIDSLSCTQKEELYQIILRIMCSDKNAREQENRIIEETEKFIRGIQNEQVAHENK